MYKKDILTDENIDEYSKYFNYLNYDRYKINSPYQSIILVDKYIPVGVIKALEYNKDLHHKIITDLRINMIYVKKEKEIINELINVGLYYLRSNYIHVKRNDIILIETLINRGFIIKKRISGETLLMEF